MGISDSGIAGAKQFPPTSLSGLLAARDPDSPEHRRRLERLAELYWRPVYAVIRSAWSRGPDEARDLTQEFFAAAVLGGNLLSGFHPELGSFRAYLRRAIKYFMCETVRNASRVKRGGDLQFVTLPTDETQLLSFGLDAPQTPEELFDRAWNGTVLTRALALLREKLEAEGRANAYVILERYDLEGDRSAMSYGDLGAELGLTAVQVKQALGHARRAFRALVIEVVRDYVDGPETLDREIEALLGGG